MSRKPFDPAELEIVGENPSFMPGIVPGAPIYARPITPRENLELLFSGRTPYWTPHACFLSDEFQQFRPRMFPDNYATHLVFDGEPMLEYEGNVARGWFGLDWEFSEDIGGATVRPGDPKVTDIDHWEEQVEFPNLDELDWESSSKANAGYLTTDNFRQFGIWCGFWERLMALMNVSEAAVALIDDEQKPGVHRLFSRLSDLYDDMIDRCTRYYDIDGVLIHDDWGTQASTFFSVDTCREMILPYLKRFANSCHRRGLSFEFHCCGRNEAMVPLMIEAGVDMWCGQAMNDFDMLTERYADSPIVFGVPMPMMPKDATREESRRMAREFVERYRGRRIALQFDDRDGIGVWDITNQDFLDAVYEFSRQEYLDAE